MDIFFIGLVLFAIFLALQTIKIVPQQNAWVIERFGKYNRTLEPGLSIVIPFMDRVAYRHHLTEFPIDIAPQVCITRDNTQVQVDGVLYYQVTDAARASYGAASATGSGPPVSLRWRLTAMTVALRKKLNSEALAQV